MISVENLNRGLLILFLLCNLPSYAQEPLENYEYYTIQEIILKGNKITREEVILRELAFELGDQVDVSALPQKISRSKENLLNTSVFNFVTITYTAQSDSLSVLIEMQERWYIWPYPVLEHADINFSSFLKNQEWSRIDYGLFLLINNFRGRKEILKLKTIFGYNNELNLYYYNPYIDKQQKVGLGAEIRYIRNHEVPFKVSNNELEYLKLAKDYARKTIEISNFYTYRPRLYTHHLINFKYSNISISDSVLSLNGNYFFDQQNKIQLITIGYIYNYDKRDSKVYPLEGPRFNFSVQRNGLGILNKSGNFKLKMIADENMSLSKNFFLTTSFVGQLNLNDKSSFYFSKAIGYDNYLRGMEYYVSNGNSFYISKTNLKYQIIPQTKFNINFIPSKKFSKIHIALYTNVFFDTGYVDSDYTLNNTITNEFLYSGGVGIDLVTYYDKVLRIEYSLNKFGEHGLFVHLGAPIIE